MPFGSHRVKLFLIDDPSDDYQLPIGWKPIDGWPNKDDPFGGSYYVLARKWVREEKEDDAGSV